MPFASGFLPSTHGLHFPNYWPRETPALVVDTPLGELTVGDAGNGLCGGFCFAVHDLLAAGRRPPSDVVPPAGGSPIVEYLTWRLLASWNIPGGLLTYYSWATTPDHDSLFGARPGVGRLTIDDQISRVTASIDGGNPCTLGLVTVHSADPLQLVHCHQVLAYGYSWQGKHLLIHVYDPNSPDDDDVFIGLDTSNPGGTTTIDSNVGLARAIRGFFVVPYSFKDPAAIAGPPWSDTSSPSSGASTADVA
jgi:hypothetical protein